ncbi:MAG TPA: hypothetical protein PLG60_04420, partial [Acidimicrobiales bacterium]|nr:hypothetical protein [Acidimicrobiales bacterium]
MLLIILALFWVALLAPVVVRRLRDGSTDRSIESFHAEHEVLSRQPHTVEPAHRLDQPDAPLVGFDRRPRLTVVHADDTYGSLESRASWDEWSQDYDYDDAPRAVTTHTNHYANAYSSVPHDTTREYEPRSRHRTMKAQRKLIFTRTVLGAVVLTLLGFVSGFAPLIYLSLVAWLALVGYVGLAFYAVREGYLEAASISPRLASRAPLASVQPLYESTRYEAGEHYYEEVSEFYEPEESPSWRRSAPQ